MKEVMEQVKKEMSKRSGAKHWTKKDIELIMAARISGDWSEVHKRKLYINHGGEYCYLLQVIPYHE